MRSVLPLFVTSILGLTVNAAAQTTGPPPPEAERLAREGVEAFEQRDYERALDNLERAFAQSHVEQIRFNIALCLDRMGRFREAVQAYDQAAQSPQLSEEQRARARSAAEQARSHLGQARVTSTARDRTAILDEEIPCALPCTVWLDPGRHAVVTGTGSTQRSVLFVIARRQVTQVVLPALVVPAAPAPPRGFRPTWLTFAGVGLTTAGVASTVGFGLRAQSLHDQFVAMPSTTLADDGERARDLANVSIGIAVTGGLLVWLDWWLSRE